MSGLIECHVKGCRCNHASPQMLWWMGAQERIEQMTGWASDPPIDEDVSKWAPIEYGCFLEQAWAIREGLA